MTFARLVRAFGVGQQMTGTARSSDGLDARRRKLLFRAWHRGMREMDLIMGRFADARIEQLAAAELADFEHLMEVPDRELLAWIIGEADVPPNYDTALFRRLRDFNRSGEGAK
jgi:antitoxin CptB